MFANRSPRAFHFQALNRTTLYLHTFRTSLLTKNDAPYISHYHAQIVKNIINSRILLTQYTSRSSRIFLQQLLCLKVKTNLLSLFFHSRQSHLVLWESVFCTSLFRHCFPEVQTKLRTSGIGRNSFADLVGTVSFW